MVHDYFALIISLDSDEKRRKWVFEFMEEQGIRCLPRNVEMLKRALDGRETWKRFGLLPIKSLLAGDA